MPAIPMLSYYQPHSLAEALTYLAPLTERPVLLAGATDFIPRMKRPNAQPAPVVDLSALQGELNYLRRDEEGLHIGPLTTHTQVAESPLVREAAAVLALSAAQVGSRQIRNKGTLAGNIANASPAGDTLPALLVLEARLCLRSAVGCRWIGLGDFLLGPSRIDLAPNELIAEILLPAANLGWQGCFRKLGMRNALNISLVSIALVRDGADHPRFAFGSVAPYPVRFPQAEALWQPGSDGKALATAVKELVRPIADIRGSAEYRREMCGNLLLWGLYEVGLVSAGQEVCHD